MEVPISAKNLLEKELSSLKNKRLDGYWKGHFFYVTFKNTPLCRLAYQGNDNSWGFAIYKYSTEKYSSSEFLFPTQGTVKECIKFALNAYNL